ncbi:hypothetical protein T09_7481 [Trichinella sp. T9]|nr:hypothetical protein T09_7481 [Trichinella sp. T9]
MYADGNTRLVLVGVCIVRSGFSTSAVMHSLRSFKQHDDHYNGHTRNFSNAIISSTYLGIIAHDLAL